MIRIVDGGASVEMTPEELAAHQASFPPFVPPPPVPAIVASGVFTVTGGWLAGIEAAAGIAMAFAVDVGTYWLLFSEPQPDLAYASPASSSQGQINVQRSLEYVEVTVRDGAGNLIDPSEFSINIVRTQ